MSYVQPKSMTFWSGALAIGLGVLGIVKPEIPHLPELSRILADTLGASNGAPAVLITTGFGMIGMRRAIREDRPDPGQ
ncbi:MAG: hypothetical protein KDA73_10495 [Rhodobacteraceae bacterium]|nr:hypothetical protein [Paracoccaceae bacterium]